MSSRRSTRCAGEHVKLERQQLRRKVARERFIARERGLGRGDDAEGFADRDGYTTLILPQEKIRIRTFRVSRPKPRSAQYLREARKQRVNKSRMRYALLRIEREAQLAEIERVLESLADGETIMRHPDGTYQSWFGYAQSLIGSSWDRQATDGHFMACRIDKATEFGSEFAQVTVTRLDPGRRGRRETMNIKRLVFGWRRIA